MSYKRQNNQSNFSQQPYQSGMSAQQKYLQIVDSVKNSMSTHQNTNRKIKGCSIHPQTSKKCRKCKQIIQISQITSKQQNNFSLNIQLPNSLRLSTENPWSYLSEKLLNCLQQQISKGRQFQQAKIVKQLVNMVPRQQINIQFYLKGTTQVPTQFAFLFYKLMRMRPTFEQITIMLRHNNVNVKTLALLYIRAFVNFEDIYGWLSSKFQDHDLINAEMTVSEFSKRLLDQNILNYDGLRLPRLPVKIQKAINQNLGQVNINADQRRKLQMIKVKQQQQVRKLKMQQNKQKLRKLKEEKHLKNKSIQKIHNNYKSRSRQKKPQKRRRDSSSSSSSSSSSQSSSSQSQKFLRSFEQQLAPSQQLLPAKQLKSNHLDKKLNQSLSIEALKAKIKTIEPIMDKKSQILSRYLSNQQLSKKQHKLDEQQMKDYEESGSQQKYQMG